MTDPSDWDQERHFKSAKRASGGSWDNTTTQTDHAGGLTKPTATASSSDMSSAPSSTNASMSSSSASAAQVDCGSLPTVSSGVINSMQNHQNSRKSRLSVVVLGHVDTGNKSQLILACHWTAEPWPTQWLSLPMSHFVCNPFVPCLSPLPRWMPTHLGKLACADFQAPVVALPSQLVCICQGQPACKFLKSTANGLLIDTTKF